MGHEGRQRSTGKIFILNQKKGSKSSAQIILPPPLEPRETLSSGAFQRLVYMDSDIPLLHHSKQGPRRRNRNPSVLSIRLHRFRDALIPRFLASTPNAPCNLNIFWLLSSNVYIILITYVNFGGSKIVPSLLVQRPTPSHRSHLFVFFRRGMGISCDLAMI